jgi:hypothetical protein
MFRERTLKILCVCTVAVTLAAGGPALRQTRGTPRGAGVNKSPLPAATLSSNIGPSPRTADQDRDTPGLSKTLRKYDLLKFNPRAAISQIRRTGKLVLKTSERVFDIKLFSHDLRSKDYVSQAIGANGVPRTLPRIPADTYKGFVQDLNGAQVRLTIADNSIEGAIITKIGRYFIQPARSFSKTAGEDEFVFYNGQDISQDAGTCGVTLADQVAAEEDRARSSIDQPKVGGSLLAGSQDSSDIAALNPQKIVRLATDADAEYVAALGGPGQANSHILSIMNQVDGIYQVELGITFQIVFQNAWTDAATDPYRSTDGAALLNEFSNHWNANFKSTPRDLAHLWTGKYLGGTLGTANLGAVCRKSDSAYGWSRRYPDNPANPVAAVTVGLTAHEIGHNLGAAHTDQPTTEIPADIGPSCRGTIMQSSPGNGLSFCPFSRSQIAGFINTSGNCLSDSAAAPPAFPTCVDVPIEPGVAMSGALSTTDCRSPSRGLSYFADRYSFPGQAGQRLNITMNTASPELVSFLYLIGPDGSVITQDAFSNGNSSARIPPSGSLTLPYTGTYIIEATSFDPQATGSYTLQLSSDGCALSVTPAGQHFSANGGSGVINVTATGSGCSTGYQFSVWPNSTTWLRPQVSNGSGSQTLGFNVQANSGAAARQAFLVVGASFGTQEGGLFIPITQSGTGPDCLLTPIAFGETIIGNLSTADCQSPVRGNGFFFADRYVFNAAAGQEVAILTSASNVSNFLTLIGPTGRIILTDVDGGGPGKARIPGGTGLLKLGLPGQYVIEVTSYPGGATGPYSLTLLTSGPPMLLTEENSERAIALESVSLLRDPFPLAGTFNLSADQQTRIILFAANLGLLPGENQSAVTAVAEDEQMNSYPLTVEFVGKVPGFGWLSQIVVRLPSNLPLGQDVRVSVTLRGRTSNKGLFRTR